MAGTAAVIAIPFKWPPIMRGGRAQCQLCRAIFNPSVSKTESIDPFQLLCRSQIARRDDLAIKRRRSTFESFDQIDIWLPAKFAERHQFARRFMARGAIGQVDQLGTINGSRVIIEAIAFVVRSSLVFPHFRQHLRNMPLKIGRHVSSLVQLSEGWQRC